MKVSFTHLIAWAIVKAAEEWPVDGPRLLRGARGQARLSSSPARSTSGIAVDIERKGQRALMVPCIKGADTLDFARLPLLLRGADHQDAREQASPPTTSRAPTSPSPTRAGSGPSPRCPRLMTGQGTIIACGSLAYPVEWAHAPPEKVKALGVSKVMTMTSTYDHRIIQGAESGSFLRRIEELLQGEDDFYESVASDLGGRSRRSSPTPIPPQPPPRRLRRRARRRPPPRRREAGRRAAAGGAGRHLAAEGLPDPRPPRRPARPARLRAEGRSRDRAREPQPDPGADGADPGGDPADRGRGRDPARGPAADARGLLRHDRVPDRAPLLAPAARCGCGR